MSTTDQHVMNPGRTRPVPVEDPRTATRMVEAVARYAVEIVRDLRPATALQRVVTPEVSAMLARRADLTRRLRASTGYEPSPRIAVTGARSCIVNERTVEASCVVREPGRARFLAMRWELRHSGWRVTVLEIG